MTDADRVQAKCDELHAPLQNALILFRHLQPRYDRPGAAAYQETLAAFEAALRDYNMNDD